MQPIGEILDNLGVTAELAPTDLVCSAVVALSVLVAGDSTDGYDAVGCGADIAFGSLHTSKGQAPRTRVRRALEAAAHHSAGVAGPFVIKTSARV
jgi:hypothetical protein